MTAPSFQQRSPRISRTLLTSRATVETYRSAFLLLRHLGFTERNAARLCISVMTDARSDRGGLFPGRSPFAVAQSVLDQARQPEWAGEWRSGTTTRAEQELQALWKSFRFSDFEAACLDAHSPDEVHRLRRRR